MQNCIFCKIVKGEIPSYKVWEDDKHMAFLSIYPEIQGMTIVIPKEHTQSYVFSASDAAISDLMRASKQVASILDAKLDNVDRTCLLFEGFEVDHLHAKLYPIKKDQKHMPPAGNVPMASAEELKKVCEKLQL